MNTEKLEKLKKSLDNKFIPDSMKDKIRTEIQKLESEIKEKEVTPNEIKEEIKNIEVKVEYAIEVAEKKEEKQEKPTRKTTPKAKAPTEKKSKPTAMALAKEIRKEGETWKDAVARATKEMNGVKEEVKKETKSEIEKLKSLIRKRKDLKGVSSSDLMRDGHRKALPSGKRTSATGHTYYENRRNRTDKGKVGDLYLAKGGSLNSYNVIYSTKSGRTMVAKNIMATNKAEAEAKLKKEMSASNTFDKVVMVHESFAKGGAIPNNYEGKTANQVWNMWTPKQREHFLADHYDVMDKDDLGAKNKSFKELNFLTQSQLELHIEQGQYANGGMMNNMSVHEGTDFMNTPVYAGGGGVDYYEQLAVYVQGVGSLYNGTSMKKAINIANSYNKKHPNAEIVIVDEKYGDEYDLNGINKDDYANGGFMDGVYAEEGAEVTYTRNKDGIRVKSVAMPEERLTEAEWLAKHNESREARTYAVGGGIFADTFSGYTGTHYTGLVGETNAMSSGEMFMAGGRVRRTKAQMTKDRENKEIDAYNWYVVDLEENKAITGNEYREDAVDALSDYDGDKRYKVVSKKTLKSLGIENPNERFKSYEVGGGVGDLFENYDEQPEELAEIVNFYMEKFDEGDYDYEDSKNFLKEVEAIGYTFDYGLDNEPYGLRPIGTELDEYADGGAIANQQLIADAHLRPAEMFGREGIPAYNKGGALKTERRYVNHSQDYETRYARKHPSRHGYGNIKYDGGGDVTQFGKFISSQIEHLISLKTIASKKEPIQNLLKNMDDYRGTEIEKRITTDNLKYALQQKTVSKMNEVLRISLNALKD